MERAFAYVISAGIVGFGVWILMVGLSTIAPALWARAALIPIAIGLRSVTKYSPSGGRAEIIDSAREHAAWIDRAVVYSASSRFRIPVFRKSRSSPSRELSGPALQPHCC
jgi:hypothetical protein